MNFFAYLWLGLLILFLMVEGATVALVSVWFAVGAVAAAIAALLGASVWLQVFLFLGVAVALLALLRPAVRKFLTPPLQKTNADALIGKTCPVTDAISNLRAQGQVKVNGMTWTARSADGTDIPKDAIVKIERIEGVKLIVSPVRLPESV